MSLYCVEFTFSQKRSDGTNIPLDEVHTVTTRILEIFAEEFGGARAYSSRESYKTQSGEIISEPSTVILSYTKTLNDFLPKLRLLADEVASALEQESVLLCITESKSNIHWISPEPLYNYIKSS